MNLPWFCHNLLQHIFYSKLNVWTRTNKIYKKQFTCRNCNLSTICNKKCNKSGNKSDSNIFEGNPFIIFIIIEPVMLRCVSHVIITQHMPLTTVVGMVVVVQLCPRRMWWISEEQSETEEFQCSNNIVESIEALHRHSIELV